MHGKFGPVPGMLPELEPETSAPSPGIDCIWSSVRENEGALACVLACGYCPGGGPV